MNPTSIDKLFPLELQHKYVSSLKGRVGVTRTRAEYFVKLWAYLLLKQQLSIGKPLQLPLTSLSVPEGYVACTHREAYELFYGEKERGSDRAAGLMIDKFVALGLIDKEFDGNNICIRIRSSLPNISDLDQKNKGVKFVVDGFNPRTDAIPLASFLAPNYNKLHNNIVAEPHRIARILRDWAEQYRAGMRVLRRSDNQNPVGFYMVYPVARESEKNLFQPPRKSLYLTSAVQADPIKMAPIGDKNCTSVFVRSWQIDFAYKQKSNVCLLLSDIKQTLIRMQEDYPQICDMYTMTMHPTDEQLALALGFHKTSFEPQFSFNWIYMPIDKYLTIDIEQAVSRLKFD